jgi:hypothetical protein
MAAAVAAVDMAGAVEAAEAIDNRLSPLPIHAYPVRLISITRETMITPTHHRTAWIAASFISCASFLLAGGCAAQSNSPQPIASSETSAQTPAQSPGQPGEGQPVFDSDKDAVAALLAAVKAQDHDQVHRLLGPAWKELVSGDKVEDANAFKEFAGRAAEKMHIDKKDESTSFLYVGKDDWRFPIPIVKAPDGKWFLDTEAGKEEVLARRIGQNELEAIAICRLYVQAQREYASQVHDDSDVLKYAQCILSRPGKQDGLYWPAAPGQAPSPLARLVGQAKLEGYTPGQHAPYHGYRFRVLKRQGESAPGGKYDYVINGNMVAGFALVAYPADYESSGIMTFIVSQRGKVFQKDLGPATTEIARKMNAYNPDSTWTLVKD